MQRVAPYSIGLATARRAQDRTGWRMMVETPTLQQCLPAMVMKMMMMMIISREILCCIVIAVCKDLHHSNPHVSVSHEILCCRRDRDRDRRAGDSTQQHRQKQPPASTGSCHGDVTSASAGVAMTTTTTNDELRECDERAAELDGDAEEEEKIPDWIRCSPADLYFKRDSVMIVDVTLRLTQSVSSLCSACLLCLTQTVSSLCSSCPNHLSLYTYSC